MDNLNLLVQLQEGTRVLLDIAGAEIQRSSETDSQFSLQLCPRASALGQILAQLSPYANLFSIRLEHQIQHGSGTASLKPSGLTAVDWSEDPDLSPPTLSPELANLYADLAGRLSRRGESIDIERLLDDLGRLELARASVRLSLQLFLDKTALTQSLAIPKDIRCLLFVESDKFLQLLRDMEIPAIGELLTPASEHAIILLLGDAAGIAEGPNIRLLGRDQWILSGNLDFKVKEIDSERIHDSILFQNEESNWEIVMPGLTPYHLFAEGAGFNNSDILETIAQLRERLCIAYLADRLGLKDGTLTCEFKGQKKTQVRIPPLGVGSSDNSVFKLFAWAFENSSSDKLGIVRQIISIQLGDNAERNYSVLCSRAGEILGIAKSNFQLFLRRSVELYFDKRLKVSEFLQKFSEEVGTRVSDLTSELVGNLYKTIGVILGVVIAALVDPKQTPVVAYYTSLLYLVYVTFILVYLLPSAYWRFRNKVQEYQYNVSELRDVLSEEEISRLQGTSYQRARRMFLVLFAVTNILYACLAGMAFLLTQNFSILLSKP